MNGSDPQGDLLQTPAQDPVQSELAQLRQQCQRLRLWLMFLCAALVPLVLAVDLYFARQVRAARAQLNETRAQFDRAYGEFRNNNEPKIKNFVAQLHTFASTNRDLQPLLDRYRPLLGQYYPLVTHAPGVPAIPTPRAAGK